MKRFMALVALTILATGAVEAHAGGFYFGDETKGGTVSANEADVNVRVRMQPRLDYGDIIKSKDGKSYTSASDLYFRRMRLEVGGHLLAKTIKYRIDLSADKWDKTATASTVILHNAYVEWLGDDMYNVIVGKEKLPYSRVSLSSSSQQLLIERPSSTEDAKKVFGKTEAFYQPKIGVKGKFLDGIVAYEVAVADGWKNGEAIQTAPARTVYRSGIVTVARVELSPPGLMEKKKSDAHLGSGKHLTLGLDTARQGGIEYSTTVDNKETRTLRGFDLSGHYEGFTAQFEWNEWKIDSTDPSVATVNPRGWYAQAGYFIDGLNIEPVARYESYNQDTKSLLKGEKNTTVGLNWYLKGHSLKTGVNWVHTKYEANATGALTNATGKDAVQVQMQMYF
ncbi:MAG: hypothetical protein A3J24_04085 [Deltaproteobacteria bacterium RIFCSPLOWO2_02_FULL_53_8]|nr:MAG: hypothetical protein A3J24_04085 [Deltaproteobacteria bacterium RIFCSPLOWO2_02_FULL_53_8]